MNHLFLVREVLNVAAITDIVSADTCEAISLFVGTTGDNFEGRKVLSLEYEANEPMALKQMETLCEDLRRQWPDILNIAIYHRLGLVPVRESSVVIAISSPHCKTSSNAVETAIEMFKKNVPIEKKETYEDNKCSWKENKESNELGNRKSIQFDEHKCKLDDTYELPNTLVQISVDEEEIDRRVNRFVERKRNEIDLCNIMDYTEKQKQYCGKENNENNLETCARVNCSITKQEFHKGHLKVKRIVNNVGPQMRPYYLNALDKLMTSTENNLSLTKINNDKYFNSRIQSSEMLTDSTVINRMENIEQHLNISPSSNSNIYKRLKNIEDRILYLECISPEYHNFLQDKFNTRYPNYNKSEGVKNGTEKTCFTSFEHKIYNGGDIDSIIQSLENHN